MPCRSKRPIGIIGVYRLCNNNPFNHSQCLITFNDSIDMITPIFEKYHVTKEQFDSTMAEYTRYPDLLDKVYDEVIMKLNVMIDEIDEQTEKAEEFPPRNLNSPYRHIINK
ncbi:MAG TPA: DUF4296 domain-containing protein [Bacteroidaceae bacterium]|nr:DUF4296 domain-containing protein [Bacteroidaceae bacterium]